MYILIATAAAVLVLAISVPWLIRLAYRVPRCTVNETPADLKLLYRECRIATVNGKWLPQSPDRKR
ncbi:hypothetical protein [Thiolapillus sp.]|uniref:hypothetical protein n=1 Tax=Thiolapillus sp. TaxID=2017437 RepID=UPI003AF7B084